MQYGLFLKGIGLSMDDALKFWRSEFAKGGIDGDKVGSSPSLYLQALFVFSSTNIMPTIFATTTAKRAREPTTLHTVASRSL